MSEVGYAYNMKVCIHRRAGSIGSTIYVCMHDICMYYVCMYISTRREYLEYYICMHACALFAALIGALVGIDVSKVENTCVADIRGRSINNSSVTFRPFINIAGDYHSSPCIHVPNSSQSPDSGFGLPSPSNLTYSHK